MFKNTKQDRQLSRAVEVISRNCGKHARAFILSSKCKLSQKKIKMISRMAPPRQRDVIKCAIKGKPFKRPLYIELVLAMSNSKSKPVLVSRDTEVIPEVLNRLQRAEGMIAKNVMNLPRLKGVVPTEKETGVLREKLKNIRLCLRLLADQLKALRMAPPMQRAEIECAIKRKRYKGPRYIDRVFATSDSKRKPALPPCDTKSIKVVLIQLSRAEGLIAKNVIDIPRLKGVVPTEKELVALDEKLTNIALCCSLLAVQSLTGKKRRKPSAAALKA